MMKVEDGEIWMVERRYGDEDGLQRCGDGVYGGEGEVVPQMVSEMEREKWRSLRWGCCGPVVTISWR